MNPDSEPGDGQAREAALAAASETLGVTAQHPFFVLNRAKEGFVPAGELRVGDVFSMIEGGQAVLEAIHTQDAPYGSTFTTYNFEVEDHHTYFAGDSGVWVHNEAEVAQQCSMHYRRLPKK